MSADQQSGGSSKLMKFGGIAVVIAAAVGWQMYKKSGNSAEASDAIKSWVVALPIYNEEKDYMDKLMATHHEEAFSASYTSSRRRTRFDIDKYASMFFSSMIKQSKADKKEKVASALSECYAEFQKEQNKPEPK